MDYKITIEAPEPLDGFIQVKVSRLALSCLLAAARVGLEDDGAKEWWDEGVPEEALAAALGLQGILNP